MNLVYRFLPSSKIDKDTLNINLEERFRPLKINSLKLISPVKKLILSKREELNNNLKIERDGTKKGSLIIPYRNREEHLKEFLPAIEKYFEKHNLDIEIIIVEQLGEKLFNRGFLMNLGAFFADKNRDYYIFHDVDLIPINNSADYSFSNFVMRVFSFINKKNGQDGENFKNIYLDNYKSLQKSDEIHNETIFGGITIIPKDVLKDVNGFSNEYWHWGSEDDDFLMRLLLKGHVPFLDSKGEFNALFHERSINITPDGTYHEDELKVKELYSFRKKNSKRFSNFKRGLISQENDGLNSIEKIGFKIVKRETLGNKIQKISIEPN